MRVVTEEGICEHCNVKITYSGTMSGPCKIWDDEQGDYCCNKNGQHEGSPHKPTHEDWP